MLQLLCILGNTDMYGNLYDMDVSESHMCTLLRHFFLVSSGHTVWLTCYRRHHIKSGMASWQYEPTVNNDLFNCWE